MRGAWKEMHFDRIFEAIATLAEKLEISKKYLTTKTDFFFHHCNGTTTLGIATLRIMTLSIMTLSINDTQHDNVNLKAVMNFKLGCFCLCDIHKHAHT